VALALRRVVPDDRALLLAVYASTRAEELAVTGWPEETKAAFLAQQFDAQDTHYRAHFPDASQDVILVDGEPAGRLYVDRREDEILLVEIALLPAFRGRGAGGELLRAVISEAEAAGKPVSIHVERENRALGLYERLGFRPVGEHGVHLRMEWDPAAFAQAKMAS
jgi:ribosomal protein S18 acetylase RimI-like enzyme